MRAWYHHALAAAGILGIVGALIAVLFIASAVRDRLLRKEVAAQQVTYVAQPTKETVKIEKVPVVRQVMKLRLTPAEELALEKQYHLAPGTLSGAAKKPPPAATPGTHPTEPEVAGEDVIEEVDIKPLRYGGTALATLDDDGKTKIRVDPKGRPEFAFGGLQRTGVGYDPFERLIDVHHQQDFLRVKAVVVGVRPFVSWQSDAVTGRRFNYGLPITLDFDWNERIKQ